VAVKQISVNLENVPGKLSEVNDYLEENGINMIALSVADTTDMSLIRFVASDPEKAANVLKSRGYSVNMIDVLAVEVPNHPGGLKAVLKPLKEISVNVNYLYVGLGTGEKTVLIMGVDKMVEATQVLKKNWIQIFDEELYSL
jgi:hypothetical protein